MAANLDLNKFYNISLSQRNELSYPPFTRIGRVLLEGSNQLKTYELSKKIGRIIEKNKFEVLGPSIAPIEKNKKKWRYHLIIKNNLESPYEFQKFYKLKILQIKQTNIKISLDIDPINML